MNLQHFLLSANESNSASNYLPIALQIIFAAGFVAFMILASSFLGPKRKTSDKLETFTSGIESHGDARSPMAIKYFLVVFVYIMTGNNFGTFYKIIITSTNYANFFTIKKLAQYIIYFCHCV